MKKILDFLKFLGNATFLLEWLFPLARVNTLERSWADKWSKLIGKDYFIQKLNKNTLTSVVKKFKIQNKIDLLNIDVEGHEIEVLNGSDFKFFRPKIITIEIHVKKTQDIFKTRVFKILQKNKYELISHYYHTCFFKAYLCFFIILGDQAGTQVFLSLLHYHK